LEIKIFIIMSFGAKKIFPIDTKPGTAVGVSIPFNAPSTFFSTYTTQDAIRNNLINYLLTNTTERFLNNDFGANLRQFIFETITNDNMDDLKETVQQLISNYFPNIKIDKLDILQSPDTNEIQIQMYYSIIDTGITDQVQITFT
jgi:phage baseplate assembly protein W